VTLVFRYVASEFLRSYLLVTLAMIALFDLIAFLAEAEDIGDARYTLVDALAVITYSTPALLVDLTPFVALLATLNALANLDGRSEVTALRVAGTSRAWFVGSTAAITAAFVVIMIGVEIVARPLHLEASLLKMYETARTGNPLEGKGFWTRSGDTIANVANLEDSRRPGRIRIYTLAENGRLASYERAESAEALASNRWRLDDVTRKRFEDGVPVALERVEHAEWSPVWGRAIDIYSLTVTSLSIADLRERPPDAHADRIELWHRLQLPLSTLAYAVLACAYSLGGRGRGGKSLRMAIGIAAALLLYLAGQLLVNGGILLGLPVPLVSLLPSFAVLVLARLLLLRAV
jgi:LPS export ABC transporter permease LptG